MRLPVSVSGKATKPMKTTSFEVVKIFDNTGIALEEFGITESGNEIQAYVKVSPGSPITLSFEIPCNEPQIVDTFIDGILRKSIIATNSPVNTHRGNITKVCACDIRPSGLKGKLEYCDMVVEERKISKDKHPSAQGFEDLQTSAVGTIEVRILREIKPTTVSHKDIRKEQAERGPTFEDNLRWWDVSSRVDPGRIAPTYQIRFTNGRKTQGGSRKNVNRSINGYYMWASFKFLYRSALDIHTAGFDRNDPLPNASSNIKADRSTDTKSEMANVQLAATFVTDKQSIPPLEATSSLSTNQIDSCKLQPPELGPVKSPNDGGIIGNVGHVKEELYEMIPPKFTDVPNAAVAASYEDQKASEVTVKQQSYKAYYETEYSGGDDRDTKPQPLRIEALTEKHKKPRKGQSSKSSKPPKQAPLLGSSPRMIIGVAEQAASSFAKHSTIAAESSRQSTKTAATNTLESPHEELQDHFRITEPTGQCDASSSSSLEGPQSKHGHSLETLATAVFQNLHPQDSSDANSIPLLSLDMASAEDIVQERCTSPGTANATEPSLAGTQRIAPSPLVWTKAGHYSTRSPLVGSDTEDMVGLAKAMTNGKGDWRDRVAGVMQSLSGPGNNLALTEDSLILANSKPYIGQRLVAEFRPSPVSQLRRKRKLDEIDTTAMDTTLPSSSRPSSMTNQNRMLMSPKARREELVRRRHAKQDQLEKAKAEADTLRREVEEVEAEQAEAIAQEEAELDKLDKEIENIHEEAQFLAARLRELHEQ